MQKVVHVGIYNVFINSLRNSRDNLFNL